MVVAMARVFVAMVSDPTAAFARLNSWAQSNGFQLSGSPTSGWFRGTPGGIAGLLIGEISGSYVVNGTEVTLRTDKDLPPGEVESRLAKVGLRMTGFQ
jgi:hypothetical protein